MGKKSSKEKEFWNSSAVRTLSAPDWETNECGEAECPLIIIKPKAWAKLSQCLFSAGDLEFGAYGITHKDDEHSIYVVEDIIIPEQEASAAFVQPLFPEEEHAVLQAEDENTGLFTHIHSHHSMNSSFSGYDHGGPLRNNLASVVINHEKFPQGFAVVKTPCDKVLRTDAVVVIGEDMESAFAFTTQFRKQWKKPAPVKYTVQNSMGFRSYRDPMGSNFDWKEKNTGKKSTPMPAYSSNPVAILRAKDDASVVIGKMTQMGWLARMVVDKVNHYRLDANGKWFHEKKQGSLHIVNDVKVKEELWRMFWCESDIELCAAVEDVFSSNE